MPLPLDTPTSPSFLPPQKKRRWWLYVLIALSSLFLLVILGLAGGLVYVKKLIKTHTSTQAAILPKIVSGPGEAEILLMKFNSFKDAVMQGRNAGAFKVSGDDLNTLIARDPMQKDRLYLEIKENRLHAQFTFPLGQGKEKDNPLFKDRYLNGEAWLGIQLKQGKMVLTVEALKTGGSVIPEWIQKKLRQINLLDKFAQNPETTAFLGKLKGVEIQSNQIVLIPAM